MKIKIGGKYFLYFNGFAVSRKLDSVASTFSFISKFNPDDLEARPIFKPFTYPSVEVYTDDDKLLLTGSITTHDFNSKSAPELVQVSGYSKGGILEDCNIPLSSYPLESINGNLRDISTKLLNIYGLTLIVDKSVQKEVGLNYAKSVAEPTETVKDYLAKMAAQRNIVVSHDAKGNILYFRPDTKAVSKYSFTKENCLSMSMGCNGQDLHSTISVIREPSHKNGGVQSSDTVNNPLCKIKRTSTKKMSSGEDTNTTRAVKAALAAELTAMTVTVNIKNWIDDLECGDIVDLQNPDLFLFNKTRFMVREIAQQQNQQEKTMDLTLMLPEAFTGDIPKAIFD